MPFVTPALLGSIREQAARTGAEICVPESESPFGIEPFCAYYAVAVSERLEAFLDAGGGPAHAFLERCRVHRIPIGELRRYGDPSVLFMSVNDQDDLDRARALAGSSR
jgi:molybdopterin-guanine dinucleotide biosynthesis protein A